MDWTGPTNNYLLASPASRGNASAAPMLLHFGDADLEVMPTQNEALRAGLNNAGAKTETVIVRGGKHSYSLYETDSGQGGSLANPIDVRAHTIGFYDRYLLPKAPSVISAASVSAIRSAAVSYQIRATHGANFFSASGLPTGWSIDQATGVVTGTMPSSGTRTFTVYATGPEGTAAQTVTFTATEGITFSNTATGTTPDLLGYNLAHFTDTGNAMDWFRYSGVKGARVFISASELQSQTSKGRTNVTSETTFWSTISNARNAGPGSSTYIRWSDFNYDYTSTSGANDITYKYAFTQLRNLGVDVLANITASPGTFPITSATDWAGKWELWQHFYAQAYLLARDYDIRRFSMFNEPNNWAGMTEADWFQRLRICSDAIQKAIADVNAVHGKSLVPRIYAPNTANGKEKYNTADDTWGRDTIVNRYLQLSNTTGATWTPRTSAIPWSLSHVYNYQK
ncbi:MAG: putative Ig domain-containing protein, partial [Sphaerospermopsis kisseleviana]